MRLFPADGEPVEQVSDVFEFKKALFSRDDRLAEANEWREAAEADPEKYIPRATGLDSYFKHRDYELFTAACARKNEDIARLVIKRTENPDSKNGRIKKFEAEFGKAY